MYVDIIAALQVDVSRCFSMCGFDVSAYFWFGGNERNSLFFVVGNLL